MMNLHRFTSIIKRSRSPSIIQKEKGLKMRMIENRMEERGTEHSRELGAAMREDRKKAGYTIRELADKMDFSPTHLTRIESGERLMDSLEKMILFCDACEVPIEKYLVLCGMRPQTPQSPARRAFPAIQTAEQEDVVAAFVRAITSKKLTPENLRQIVVNAIAYAEYCDKQNSVIRVPKD